MKRLLSASGLLLLSSALALGQPAEKPAATKGPVGFWEGALHVGAVKLRLAITITKTDDSFTGTMDSLDQGAKGIKIDQIKLTERKLRLELRSVKAVFEGELNADGTQLTGQWEQGPGKLPITFKRVEKLTELKRPQLPVPPFPYAAEEVRFENASANAKLSGTLTLPRAAGPHPAAILISGSGPQDRDESLMGHKPFLVLADYLTRQGIAVLRYDDRGVGKSTGDFAKATSADFATDVEAAIAFLKSRKDIAPHQIGLIGHSEGGLIAPMVASRNKDVAFIVLLAGPGLSGEEILFLQGQAILKAMGGGAETLARQRTMQERIFKLVREEKDNAVAEKKLKEIMDEEIAKLNPIEKKLAEASLAAAAAQAKQVLSPWFRFFLAYDPRSALTKTQCPVLAIIGEKDLQVPPKENNPAIEQALKAGGNRDFTVKELPGLNHLFQTSKSGAVTEYGEIEETFAPEALKLIGEWIAKRCR